MKNLLVCLIAALCAIELTEDELERTESYRKLQVAILTREINGIEKDIKSATQARDHAKATLLKNDLAQRKKARNKTKQATTEDLFQEMRAAEQKNAAIVFERERREALEKKIAAAGPISILGMGINTNVIGLPEITIEVKNNTEFAVEALEFDADCFNKFDEPVRSLAGDNRFSAHWKYEIAPGATQKINAQMSLHRLTAKADVWISRVKLSNGDVWKQTKEEANAKAFGLAKARLME